MSSKMSINAVCTAGARLLMKHVVYSLGRILCEKMVEVSIIEVSSTAVKWKDEVDGTISWILKSELRSKSWVIVEVLADVKIEDAKLEALSIEYGRDIDRVLSMVYEERARQVTVEKFDDKHDDAHEIGELSIAAACYLIPETMRLYSEEKPSTLAMWPWEKEWWKPCPRNRIREIIKGLSLGVAEVERLFRLQRKQYEKDHPTPFSKKGDE